MNSPLKRMLCYWLILASGFIIGFVDSSWCWLGIVPGFIGYALMDTWGNFDE
jgi:hypothetical protein